VVSVRVEVGEHHVPVTRSSNKVALETQTLPILLLQTQFQNCFRYQVHQIVTLPNSFSGKGRNNKTNV
jgi:hypothetical protein